MIHPSILLSIILLLPFFLSAQEVQVHIESEDPSWEYRGDMRAGEAVLSEANLAEALSNYEAPELPMTYFSAQPQASQIQLEWTSGSPRQAYRLYVQRSSDGVHWQEIGMITGSEEHLPLQDWAFEDEEPLHGPNFYRLRQVTADGHSVTSDELVMETCPGGFHTTFLYPHPGIFGTRIHLELDTAQAVRIRLLDDKQEEIGMIFRESAARGNHDIEVDVTELEPGTYYCEITVGDQQSIRRIER